MSNVPRNTKRLDVYPSRLFVAMAPWIIWAKGLGNYDFFFFLVLYVQLHIEQVKAQRKEDFSCIRVKRKREGNTSKTGTQMGKI